MGVSAIAASSAALTSVSSLSVASLDCTAAAAIQTEITSPSDQLRLVPVHVYSLPASEVVAALRANWSALPTCNTQPEAAFPGALVKMR